MQMAVETGEKAMVKGTGSPLGCKARANLSFGGSDVFSVLEQSVMEMPKQVCLRLYFGDRDNKNSGGNIKVACGFGSFC